MASQADLTANFTPDMWEAFSARGLVKETVAGTGRSATIVRKIVWPSLDRLLVRQFVAHPVESTEEFLEAGFTLDRLLFDVLGLPDRADLREKRDDQRVPPLSGAGQLVKDRLRVQFDSPIQRNLNGEHSLWLIHGQFVPSLDSASISYWAATNTPDLVEKYAIIPDMRARVRTQKRSTVHGLTMMYRVPEVAAQVIAAQEQHIAAITVARARTYQAAVAALDPAQRAELDRIIAARRTSYADETAKFVAEIEMAEPSIPGTKPKAISAAATRA